MTLTLFIAVLILQSLDGWTTYQALRLFRGREANPLTKRLMDRFGVYWGLMIAKGIAVLVAGGLFYVGGQGAMIGLGLLAAVYLKVVYSNWRILYP